MRFFVCIVTVITMSLLAANAFAKPSLQVDNRSFDFGEVFQGEKVPHVFEFVNAGDEQLIITKVRSSCGCTAVLVSEKVLAPGAKGEIKANFDSTRFRGDISKTIYVYSNDPVSPVKQLKIKGKVLEIVAVEPSQVNFGKIAGDQTLSAQVQLRNQGNEPLKLNAPKTTAKELQADMPAKTLAKGEMTTLNLMLTPKPGTVRFSGYVLVPVNGVPKDELRIPVYATINKE